MAMPKSQPACPNFSSGPCAKRPGWSVGSLNNALTGRSHRSKPGLAKLAKAIEGVKELLSIPEDFRVAIVPASDTGAIEMAMWSMMGERPVTVLHWDAFGSEWFKDITNELKVEVKESRKAPFGELPDLAGIDFSTDVIFPWNGTTSGVRVPNADWIPELNDKEGLVFCDATSGAFAMDIPFEKMDVSTLSWQKAVGGEAAHGIIILSPRAVKRLETYTPPRPLPKIFRFMKAGKLNEALFKGSVINTPSLICVEDFLDAVEWAKSIGGLPAMIARSEANLKVLEAFVEKTPWLHFLCKDPAIRSCTSVTFTVDGLEDPQIKAMTAILDKANVAHDINRYSAAPLGIRIWCGCTVETSDIEALCPWLEFAHAVIVGEAALPKVLICDGMTAAGIAALEEGLCEYEHKKLSEEEVLAGGYGDYDAVVIRSATKVREAGIRAAVAKEGCKLKIIGRAGVGTDNVDSHIATDCGVMVMNAPLAATRSVAELALGHLFVAVRKICFADREMHAGAWPKKQCGGTELYGKKLGVVGYGRIGQATGLLAQAVGMEIHAYDPFMNREFAKANGTVVHETIESLFKACTHITVHTPLIKGVTENLIGKKLFDMMPGPKNFIVSVARGGVVDETAVLEALESGKLTAAGLDVFAKEPMVADHPLLKHPGFHCTPHIGANTAEGQDRCGKEMAETVVAALKGDVHMDHLVNRGVVPRS